MHAHTRDTHSSVSAERGPHRSSCLSTCHVRCSPQTSRWRNGNGLEYKWYTSLNLPEEKTPEGLFVCGPWKKKVLQTVTKASISIFCLSTSSSSSHLSHFICFILACYSAHTTPQIPPCHLSSATAYLSDECMNKYPCISVLTGSIDGAIQILTPGASVRCDGEKWEERTEGWVMCFWYQCAFNDLNQTDLNG